MTGEAHALVSAPLARPPLATRQGIRDFVAENGLYTAVVVGYIGLGALALAGSGLWDRWHVRLWYPTFTRVWLFGSAAFLAFSVVAGRRRAVLTWHRFGGAILVFALAVPFQTTFQSFKQLLPDVRGFPYDAQFARLDAFLHGGRHPFTFFDWILDRPDLVQLLDRLYILWFIFLLGFVVWLSWSTQQALRQRALLTFVLQWVVLGTLGAYALASAGPCYYDRVATGANPYAPLMSRLKAYDEGGTTILAVRSQEGLWEVRSKSDWAPFAGISAMPSLHVATVTLFALVGLRLSVVVGASLALYALAIQVGSVVLGWHYAIDGYIGAFVTLLIWELAPPLESFVKRKLSAARSKCERA